MSGIDLARQIAEAKKGGAFASLVEAIPYAKFLGVTLDVDGEALIGRLAYAPRNIGNAALPALHGGTIGALLELTASFELLWRTDTVKLPKIIGCTIEYLRTGKAEDTYAQAEIVKRGRRVTPLRVVAWQGDRSKPIAAATVQFLVG